jgi:hypothetical protein
MSYKSLGAPSAIDHLDGCSYMSARQKVQVFHGADHLTIKGGKIDTNPKRVFFAEHRKDRKIARVISRIISKERTWMV